MGYHLAGGDWGEGVPGGAQGKDFPLWKGTPLWKDFPLWKGFLFHKGEPGGALRGPQ